MVLNIGPTLVGTDSATNRDTNKRRVVNITITIDAFIVKNLEVSDENLIVTAIQMIPSPEVDLVILPS